MAKNKLIVVLSTLSTDEWKALRRYILTKTTRSSDNFMVFDYIYKKRKYLAEIWETQTAHGATLESINRKAFLNVLSVLFSWTEEWLMTKKFRETDIIKHLSLLSEYSHRGLYQMADHHMAKVEGLIKLLNPKDLDYHNYCRQLYHIVYYSNNPIKINRGTEILLKLIAAHSGFSIEHDYFYLAELHNRGHIKNIDIAPSLTKMNVRIKGNQLEGDHHLVLLEKMISKNDYKSFLMLKEKLFNEEWNYEGQSHILIIHYLIIWVMKFWHSGVLIDSTVITQLYDHGLRTKALLVDGRIPERRFHNIVSTIGALSENGWSLNFIDEWGDKVNSKYPKQNKALAHAQFLFYKKRYSEITPLLRSLKFDAEGQQVRMLGLQLIAWFEDKELYREIFHHNVINFRRFLKRNKSRLSPHYHDSHLNLISILEGIDKGNDKFNLKEYLKDTTSIIYRKYLLEKLDE